ncbi:MAG: permease-like cell division protein FtsX [Myxococcota bacterium]|nr:permease-like cell division protein FtsX [Myxococcota bacterium]
MTVFGHVLRRALRSLWENLYLNAMATTVIAAALLLMGVYLTVQYNLNTFVDSWDKDVHVSAYFHTDVPEQRRLDLRDRLLDDPAVARVRYVSEDEARDWLVERVDGVSDVLDQLGPGVLPASLEITATDPGDTTALARWADDLEGPDFQAIDYGQEWIERFQAFLSVLKLLGALLGTLILVAALFLVTNTVYLIVYNRREELEVQKLVGATGAYITAPFLLEGLLQGSLGALFSTVGLWAVHVLLIARLQDALALGMAGELAMLPGRWLVLLCVTGIVLGVGASIVAVTRFLLRTP